MTIIVCGLVRKMYYYWCLKLHFHSCEWWTQKYLCQT